MAVGTQARAATAASAAGNDTIVLGDGQKTVLGGLGQDRILAGRGKHVVFGDNGQVDFNSLGSATRYQTLDQLASSGGADSIQLGDGNNVVLAGVGADQVNTGDGVDVILGDNGLVQMDAAGLLWARIESSQTALGGDDVIRTGAGTKFILAGAGADVVQAGVEPSTGLANSAAAMRMVFGDSGIVVFNTAGLATSYQSMSDDETAGGGDSIAVGDGDNLIIGGAGGDAINAGNGANLILGDNGRVVRDAAGAGLVEVTSAVNQAAAPGLLDTAGGADTIQAGNGRNIVIGGLGGDRIRTGAGDDLAFGDNVRVEFINGLSVAIRSTDLTRASGGDDQMDLGDGDNIAIGGVGSDAVTTGSGIDVVLGDGGTILFDGAGQVVEVVTGDPLLGGDDVISLGDGNDFAFGGAGNDSVDGGGGDDTLVGDGARLSLSDGGARMKLLSIDVMLGGDDRLLGGAGTDVMIGGQGRDLLAGNFAEDLIFGNNAAVRLNGGLVEQIQADTHDLAAQTLFSLYSGAGPDGMLSTNLLAGVASVSAELLVERTADLAMRSGAVLAPTALRRLFHSSFAGGASSASTDPSEPSEPPAEVPAAPTAATAPVQVGVQTNSPPTGQPWLDEQRQAAAPLLAATLLAAPAAAAGAALVEGELPGSAADRASDSTLLTAAALALVAAPRGLLDRQAMHGKGAAESSLSRAAIEGITRRWFGAAAPAAASVAQAEVVTQPRSRQAHIDW